MLIIETASKQISKQSADCESEALGEVTCWGSRSVCCCNPNCDRRNLQAPIGTRRVGSFETAEPTPRRSNSKHCLSLPDRPLDTSSFKFRLLEPLTDRMQLHFVMAEKNTCIGHSTVPP